MDSKEIFQTLKATLQLYESKLLLVHNEAENYYLHTPAIGENKKDEFFGAVQIKKSYVAFHLMPIYYHPHLLDSVSEDLKKCMQGKSCFNFKQVNEERFQELALLTKQSFQLYKKLQKV